MTSKKGVSPFLLPTENHVLWAWPSTDFGSALLFWDLNLTSQTGRDFFKEFGMPLWGIKAKPPYEGGFLLHLLLRAPKAP